MITYAAGLKAVTVVWIAARFTEEHRAALDWLNETTNDQFRFFALEVEAWCIGDSDPAPKFNVISKPNDWSRQVAGGAEKIPLTGSRKLQLEFWTVFKAHADEHARRFRPTKPLPQNWITFALGRSGFSLSAVASTFDSASQTWGAHELRVELLITHMESKRFFELLQSQRAAIESELDEPLEWYTQQQVHVVRPDVPLQNLDVVRPADLSDQTANLRAHVPSQHRLAILRDEHEMVVQRIHRMGSSTILARTTPIVSQAP